MSMSCDFSLLRQYALLVFIIFAAEIVLGILVAIYKDDLKGDLVSMMRRQVLFEYNTTASIANRTNRITTTWNNMQMKLECCGTLGPPNYRYSTWYNHTPGNSGIWVPMSCCVLKNSDPDDPQPLNFEQCQVDAFQYKHAVESQFLHTRGCYWQLLWLAETNKWIFIGVIIGCAAVQIVVFQLIAFVFSCCMMSCLRKKQTEYPWYDEEEDE
ncbi:hypothetical protein CAPTEDRAFT_194713 [Capitella teleta]|uniref:Uncharacterized protein n=1 Tax=Capitella teleta TaxID=283909 RepID=R7VC92_CAPTE|nr:hypothetical protein CAPTEDRAFT_194713 [Capitella teleta]|eukprot:ELU16229.1 hypothetical protein CAPTEDRAFT_194713 [Capitella teleta]